MDRDYFMSPEEAKIFGLIDKILEHPPDPGTEEGGAKSEKSTSTEDS